MDGVTHFHQSSTGPWRIRNCLSLAEYVRSWYLIGTPRTIVRRLCMWAVVLLRAVTNLFSVAAAPFGHEFMTLATSAVVGILTLVFVLWCLTMIGRADGVRAWWLCGLGVGRTHLDVFLGVNVLLHIALLASFLELFGTSPAGFFVIWCSLTFFIGVYGFLCTKSPVPP